MIARKIAQGAHPEELRYIEDTIKNAHNKLCDQRRIKTAGYNVRVFSLHGDYITYINWAKG